MATPPVRVLGVTPAVGWASNASPKTSPTFDVQAGDLIVVTAFSENHTETLGAPTWTGTGTVTLRQSIVVQDYCTAYLYTIAVTATQTGRTITMNRTASNGQWSFYASVWRNHGGLGNTAKANVASGAPALSLATSANSAVVVGNSDWTATSPTGRVWRTVNGSPITETTFGGTAGSTYMCYTGYAPDTGAAGTYTYGMTSPNAQKYSIIGAEILGTASSETHTTSGTASATASASGTTSSTRQAARTASATASGSGTVAAIHRTSASAPATASASASGQTVRATVGTASASVSTTATGQTLRASVGTALAVASATSSSSGSEVHATTGTALASATATASTGTNRPLAGTAEATAAASSVAEGIHTTQGLASAYATASGSTVGVEGRATSATAPATATATAQTITVRTTSGTAAASIGVSTLTATLRTSASTATGTLSAQATTWTVRTLALTAEATASASGVTVNPSAFRDVDFQVGEPTGHPLAKAPLTGHPFAEGPGPTGHPFQIGEPSP